MNEQNRKSLGVSLGAILPALGVSLTWFCCLPIAAGAIGAAAAAVGNVLTPLRPYLTGAAIVFLGIAFYQTYKPRHVECAPGQSCGVGENRIRRQIVLWLITIVTLAMLTVGEWSSWIIYWML